MRPVTGTLFKRCGGRYVPADDPAPGKWYVKWQERGREHKKALRTTDRVEAERRASLYVANIRAKDEPDEAAYLQRVIADAQIKLARIENHAPGVPLSSCWTLYVESRRRPASGPHTMKMYAGQWRRFAEWCKNEHVEHIDDVSPALCEAYMRHMEGAELSTETIRKNRNACDLIMRVLRPGVPSPWLGVASISVSARVGHRRLTDDECGAILAAATGELRVLVTVGYCTGMRRGDAVTLAHEQIDLERGIIRYVPRKTARRKPEMREIPLIEPLRSIIARGGSGPVMPKLAALYERAEYDLSDLIRAVFNAAGVKDTADGKASFHSFRVTMQTRMDEALIPRHVTRMLTAHTGQGMSDTYSRTDVEVLRKAMGKAFKKK